ncbi:MAG TPA: hypothetical protein VNU68_35150 [Verrucomicrobiae bacterium]|nr:hypothetical protein [Verrucomicrobiae bacterium]
MTSLLGAHGSYYGAVQLTEDTPANGPGTAIQIVASVAGTVTLVLMDGSSIVVSVPAGTSIWPYQVTKATKGGATITSYYNLVGTGTA